MLILACAFKLIIVYESTGKEGEMQKWTADIADGPLMEMMTDERPLMEMIVLKNNR